MKRITTLVLGSLVGILGLVALDEAALAKPVSNVPATANLVTTFETHLDLDATKVTPAAAPSLPVTPSRVIPVAIYRPGPRPTDPGPTHLPTTAPAIRSAKSI